MRKMICTGLLLGVLAILLSSPDVALAADPVGDVLGGGSKSITPEKFANDVMNFGSDINNGTSFTTEFQKIFLGMNTVFKSIITILTVAAGAMIAFGIEDGKKTLWQFMLGIGLAYNFGAFLVEAFSGTGIFMSVDDIVASHKGANATAEILKNANANDNDDILTEIMAVYSGTIINNGAPVLQAIALRMTIALAALESGYKIVMELYSGDKVKFIVANLFKVGFYCFLIMEWINIGQALSGFFQSAGFLAAGASGFGTADPTNMDKDTTFRPDSIWHNATVFLELALNGTGDAENPGWGFWTAVGRTGLLSMIGGILTGGIGAIVPVIISILFVLFIVGLMIFISVEMFIARIEFYTMLMLSIVFLPFGVTERLAFLCNSAISLMFNSGAKMMVICFLQVMMAKTISAYLSKLTVSPFAPGQFSVLCQILIMCVFFAYITKKIPDLVSSFLNGSPALSGGGMISQAKSMATQTATVVGGTAGVLAGASAAAGGMKMSNLPKMGSTLLRAGAQNLMANNPLTQGYARGMKGVVGSNGSLQNENFMKGVRQLAGLEASAEQPGKTKSLSRLASDPKHKQPGPKLANHKTPMEGKMPEGVSKRNSASFQKSPNGMKGEVDWSRMGKSGGVATGSGNNNNNERSAPVVSPPTNGKDKEKTVEKDFRSESKHTASKEQTTVPGQNVAQKVGAAQAEKIAPAQQAAQAPAVQIRDSSNFRKAEGLTGKKMSDQQAGVQMPQANSQVQTAQVLQNGSQPPNPIGSGAGTSNAAPQHISGKAEVSGTVAAGNGNIVSQQAGVQMPQANPQVQTVQGKDLTGSTSVYTPIGGSVANSASSGDKPGNSVSDMGNFKKK